MKWLTRNIVPTRARTTRRKKDQVSIVRENPVIPGLGRKRFTSAGKYIRHLGSRREKEGHNSVRVTLSDIDETIQKITQSLWQQIAICIDAES